MFNFSALPPLALYVHFPWCVRKCPYCDFNSHKIKDDIPEKEYIDALLRDLDREIPEVWGRRIVSVFFGGGTPSLFSPESIDKLLSELRARLALQPGCEITMEANPGTAEQGRFVEFLSAGVNRLSIGVQSFNDDLLSRLGRVHNASEAKKAMEMAHHAGFKSTNLDLMFGLPAQSLAGAEHDIKTAVDLQPSHISYYQLTIEPNTLYAQNPPKLPEDDNIWNMQSQGQQLLAKRGYQQYEISAYAKAAMQCDHNLNYWNFGDYLGLGAGAHGKITSAHGVRRYGKVKQPKEYLIKAGLDQSELSNYQLSQQDAVIEFMMNAMRLKQGFTTSLFTERTGLAVNRIEKQLLKAEQLGFIQWDVKKVQPSEKGYRFLNELLQLFMA